MLNDRSLSVLKTVHPDLAKVAIYASDISEIPFIVTEGIRSVSKQKKLVACGASKILYSRHLSGHAIDVAALVGSSVRWDWPLYHLIAKAFKIASEELKIPITWGGDWASFPDGPHFELGPSPSSSTVTH